jgi:SulP family sulfate permease
MVSMGYGDLLGADGIQKDYNDALHLAWEYLGDPNDAKKN